MALAAEAPEAAAAVESTTPWTLWLAWGVGLVGSVVALYFALFFYKRVMAESEGDEKMVEIAEHVRAGAKAYLRRQYTTVAIVFVILFIVFSFMAFGLKVQALWVPFAFLTGGFFSGLCGFLGMRTATNASARTANGAKESLNKGLQVAFRSGAVMGLIVVGFGLLDICLWFIALFKLVPWLHTMWPGVALFQPLSLVEITVTMLCFGVGASTQALFARVGGGIFTKAADVGADLVGKVEAGIPEDDPRNPATIADNVGDNVGDVAGMGADLYESYCGSILATAALGVAAAITLPAATEATKLSFIFLPIALAGVGIFLSILGIFMVRSGEEASQKELMGALGKGVNLSTILVVPASALIVYLMLPGHFGVFGSIVSGLGAGWLIGKWTEYSTSAAYKPTQGIAQQTDTGPATVIIAGISEGMLSTWVPALVVAIAIMLSYGFAGGFANAPLGLYGVGLAAVGMLSTLGITLATDAYGPIADNAGGNAEMSGQEPYVRERTDALDSLGNTTAATGKGFAIGSAALTALALLAAYVEEVRMGMGYMARDAAQDATRAAIESPAGPAGDHVYFVTDKADKQSAHAIPPTYVDLTRTLNLTAATDVRAAVAAGTLTEVHKVTLEDYMAFYKVHLMNPRVIGGMLMGSMLAFVFCALTMKAVGRAASSMVEEVRRQFRDIPGLLDGTGQADYASCVKISTQGAQREMILPSLLSIIVPVSVGLVLGVAGVMGMLTAGLATGFVLAVMMANAGGAWDNAKKYIEGGAHGGKGSPNHKAAVVGDTVGDPFKDTSGPSLNILIKLMSMVAVVFAGLTVKYAPVIAGWLGI
ncbi:MAG: sodium-translocating pyrophosphatase [Candidatus Brocadiae bacterium]|nr:sodium-translocating pyrophosphatase [Candidatus Brocadiia bacterium]